MFVATLDCGAIRSAERGASRRWREWGKSERAHRVIRTTLYSSTWSWSGGGGASAAVPDFGIPGVVVASGLAPYFHRQ